jgi:hypothetical protein
LFGTKMRKNKLKKSKNNKMTKNKLNTKKNNKFNTRKNNKLNCTHIFNAFLEIVIINLFLQKTRLENLRSSDTIEDFGLSIKEQHQQLKFCCFYSYHLKMLYTCATQHPPPPLPSIYLNYPCVPGNRQLASSSHISNRTRAVSGKINTFVRS